jgi:hypothetical protein
MWEEIMHASPTTAALTPTLPASDGARPIAPRALPSASAAGWRSWLPTALLIAALVVAGIAAAWRIVGPFDLAPGGDGPETAHQPGIAGSATPAASADGCPLTSDMLVFVGEAPVGVADLGMTWLVVENGDLTVHCVGVDQPKPLATGVEGVLSVSWPGMVLLTLDDGSAAVLNIATGERLNIGDAAPLAENPAFIPNSPWFLSPANEALTDWRITNLETMTTMVLSDEIGGVLPDPVIPTMVTAPGASTAIFRPAGDVFPANPPPNDADAVIAEAPGSLVVDATLDTRRWIDTWGQMAISADGDTIAYQTQVDLQPKVRVEDARGGDVLADITDIDFNTPSNDLFAFSGDAALTYIGEGGEVRLATWDDGIQTTAIETDGWQPGGILPTGAPGRVLIQHGDPEALAAGDPLRPVSVFDARTGAMTGIDGLLYPYSFYGFDIGWYAVDRILTVEPRGGSATQAVLRVVDVRTGETLLTSDPMPLTVDEVVQRRFQVGADRSGDTLVLTLTDSWTLVFDLADRSISTIPLEGLQRLDVPREDMHWTLMPSSDGQYLYGWGIHLDVATQEPGTQFLAIGRLSVDPDWRLMEDNLRVESGVISLIPGIPAGDSNDEPAVLEAQEFATPAPATAPAASGCDLTYDMPVFVGSTPDAPFLDTYALLDDDGALALVCGETSEVIASGVARVVPTGWPGAIAIETLDGSIELRNITNGARLQVESGDLLDALDSHLGDPYVVAGAPHSPWLVSVANDDGTDWRITDLRTMESMLLSDDFDGDITVPLLPTFQTGFEAFSDRSNGNAVAVVSFQAEERPTEADLAVAAPWPGNAVVLPGSIENRRWIDTWPAFGLSLIPSASVSADGTLLAYFSPTNTDELTIRVETAVDGDLLAEVPVERDGDDFSFSTQLILLATSEPRLVHSDGTSVELISWDPEVERTVIADDALPRAITTLLPTADPDTIVVSGGTQAVTLDLATGEIGASYEYTAHPQTLVQFVDGDSHLVNLIAFQSDSPAGVPATIRVVDPVSGEVLVESEPVDINPTALAGGDNVNSLARDGTLAVVPIDDGRAIVLDADSGETWEIARPVDGVEQWLFLPSEDGRLIYAISRERYATGEDTPFSITAAVPDAEWVEVGASSPTRFIVGTHDLPAAESVEVAAPEARALATPAVGHNGCALTSDVPFFPAGAPDGASGLGTTYAVVEDGDLTIRCPGADNPEPLMTGIADAMALPWPGTVLLELDSGNVLAYNVATGEGIEFGDLASFSASVASPGSPWLLTPVGPDIHLTNLRTMHKTSLAVIAGGKLPDGYAPVVVSSPDTESG